MAAAAPFLRHDAFRAFLTEGYRRSAKQQVKCNKKDISYSDSISGPGTREDYGQERREPSC